MRKVGIVVAISGEFNAFLNDSSITSKIMSFNNRDVYECTIGNCDVFFIQSGWGEIDAATAVQLLVSRFECEIILNYGVVGALKKDMKVNEVYLVEKVVHYDFDASGIDHTRVGQYHEFEDEFMPCSPTLINLAESIYPGITSVICASADKFVDDKKIKSKLASDYNASICDMEAAGIVRTCFKNGIDCLMMKCISDTYDGNGQDFKSNVSKGSAKAFNLLKQIILKL